MKPDYEQLWLRLRSYVLANQDKHFRSNEEARAFAREMDVLELRLTKNQ